MVRIRELQRGFEDELTSEGERRYTQAEAIERAVWLEMLVADFARHPAFMRWLRDHPGYPLAEEDRAA
jgi:hypothetical protein